MPEPDLLSPGIPWDPAMKLQSHHIEATAFPPYTGRPENAYLLGPVEILAAFCDEVGTEAAGLPMIYCSSGGIAAALGYQKHAKDQLRADRLPYDPVEVFEAGIVAITSKKQAARAASARRGERSPERAHRERSPEIGRRRASPEAPRRDRERSRAPRDHSMEDRSLSPARRGSEVPTTPPNVSETLVANMLRMSAIRPKNPDAFNGKLDKDGVVGLSARAESWIYALELGVKNKQHPVTVFVAVSFLKDNALQWWKGTEKSQPDSVWNSPRGWNLFVELFRIRFILAQDSQFARKELQSLKQTATVVQFISEFDTILARISDDKKPDQTTLAGYFMDGLHKFIRSKLLGTTKPETYHNYDSLSRAARDMEYMIDSCQHGDLAYWQKDGDRSRTDKPHVKQGGRDKRGNEHGRDGAGKDGDGPQLKRAKGGRDDSRKERFPHKERRHSRSPARGKPTVGFKRDHFEPNRNNGGSRPQARLEKFPHHDSDYPKSGDRGFERGPCGYCKHDGHSINQCLALQEKKFAKGEILSKTLTPFRKA